MCLAFVLGYAFGIAVLVVMDVYRKAIGRGELESFRRWQKRVRGY